MQAFSLVSALSSNGKLLLLLKIIKVMVYQNQTTFTSYWFHSAFVLKTIVDVPVCKSVRLKIALSSVVTSFKIAFLSLVIKSAIWY